MQYCFLGTSSALPTLQRGLPALAVRYGAELLLFDCGEGTQLRLQQVRLSPRKIKHIFITHLHGDHIFGLPGLVQSLALNKRTAPLTIYCPQGEGLLLSRLLTSCRGDVTYELGVRELAPGAGVDLNADLQVLTARADHGIPALAYRVQESPRPGKFDEAAATRLGLPRGRIRKRLQKGETVDYQGRTIRPEQVVKPPRPGRSLVYTGDTRPCDSVIELAQGAQVLLHEATFTADMAERAIEAGHSTAAQAAATAKAAGVKRLVLWHFSQRYTSPEPHVEEAQAIFPNTSAAEDLEKVSLAIPTG